MFLLNFISSSCAYLLREIVSRMMMKKMKKKKKRNKTAETNTKTKKEALMCLILLYIKRTFDSDLSFHIQQDDGLRSFSSAAFQ